MTAEEARMQMLWNNIPRGIREKIESAVIMGWSQVEVDSLEANELENLKALGYCVQVETHFIDIISW
jgi:succinate dehydrogenase flavin-adding protein (antitoxin of CptAB toxin-antitoxin module)